MNQGMNRRLSSQKLTLETWEEKRGENRQLEDCCQELEQEVEKSKDGLEHNDQLEIMNSQ